MDKRLSLDEFRAAARDGTKPEGSVFRLATGPAVEVEGKARVLRFCFSDGSIDRAGDTIDPKGWEIDSFEENPVALWAHDSHSPPIGRALNVGPVSNKLMGDIEFAPPETYAFADTIFRLAKGGFLNAVSVGFNPLEWTFVNEKDRPFGIDFTRQELLEISVCPVPCNANALVEARAKGIDTGPIREWAERVLDEGGASVFIPRKLLEETFKAAKTPRSIRQRYLMQRKTAEWTCGASRDLPVDEDGAWDGPAAEASIFTYAGGDDFDPAKAKLGFLAYDASAPKLRGSYKLPFAHVAGGELKAAASGVRAAASRLPDTDIPDAVKASARAVLDAYEAKMKKSKAAGEDGDGAAVVPPGNCGRSDERACGMTDPAECAVHAPMDDEPDAAKITQRALADLGVKKAGRVLSAANEADLRAAAEHHTKAAAQADTAATAQRSVSAHNAAAADLIKSVLARHDAGKYDPDNDGDNDTPGSGGDTDNDAGGGGGSQSPPMNLSAKDHAKAVLAATRAEQARDLTP